MERSVALATRSLRLFSHVDWVLLASSLAISTIGLITMFSFSNENAFFDRQIVWIGCALLVFFAASIPEYGFLRRTPVIVGLFFLALALLALVFVFGPVVKGAQNRFDLGLFALQPSDPVKLILVALLAKYFARRHIEIAHIRHIFVSGFYVLLISGFLFFQPDLGSIIIIGSIWLGMVLVAGISWKHLAVLFLSAVLVGGALWSFGLQSYQKQRILTFLHPLADVRGSGYNAYQSTVAVGSGELLGKGVGFGTQSKLQFLPEYETDFIFAAYAEEWGFVGVLLLLGLYGVVMIRILSIAAHGADNFSILFGAGIAIMFLSNLVVHVGMNMGLLPVTGTTIPLMSYGGSHLLTEYLALGILCGMSRRAHATPHTRGTELVGAV
jgi:rod shape determining protein RodA